MKGNLFGLDWRIWSEEDVRGRSWNVRWIGVGFFLFLFVMLMIGVVYGKECVVDWFVLKDVVLY